MNLLQLEDVVKGLPDDRLFQEAQSPSGELPQFLTISEIRRRSDMRERFQAQEQQPQGTVADQVLQQGLASMQGQGPPQGQMQGYAGGGQVQPRWWERMLPMAHPNMIMRDMQPQQESNLLHHTGKPFPRLEASGNIRMQIADIQSNGMTPDLDENGQPIISWEDGEPRVVVNGQPYGYAGGGIVSFQSGGSVSAAKMLQMNPYFGYPFAQGNQSYQDIMRLMSEQESGGRQTSGPRVVDGLQQGYNESPGLAFLQQNPLFGGMIGPAMGMYREATDPNPLPGTPGFHAMQNPVSAGSGPEVNQGIASIPQSEFVGPPEPEMVGGISGGGGGEQFGGMDLNALLTPPPMPQSDRIEYPSGAAQREGLAALGAESRDMYESMAEEQRNSSIDVSDLIAGGKKDAWAAAMVQLGAGIARNDLAGGLEQAGQTGADAAKQARAMELWSRIQKAENDAKARELLASGVISEQEYKKAVLASELAEGRGAAEFEFEQRKADSDALYKRGMLHLNELGTKLELSKYFAELNADQMAQEPVPAPPEGQTMREQMKIATGMGNAITASLGKAWDIMGGDLPEPAKKIVNAQANVKAGLRRMYSALADTRAWRQQEYLEEKFNMEPGAFLGDDTAVENIDGISAAFRTMLAQEAQDARTHPDKKEREKAAHNARLLRNFLPILGSPEATAEEILSR